MAQPVVVQYDPFYLVNLPAGSVALNPGDLCSFESAAVVLVDAVGEDESFCGITLGKCGTTDSGKLLPIALKCVVEIDMTSASYTFLQDLLYTSKNTLAAASTTASLGWFFQPNATATRARVLFDVIHLGKLVVNVNA